MGVSILDHRVEGFEDMAMGDGLCWFIQVVDDWFVILINEQHNFPLVQTTCAGVQRTYGRCRFAQN